VYPEIGERMGVLPSGGPVSALLRRLRTWSLNSAALNVALGEHMREEIRRIVGRGGPQIVAIPNWAHGGLVRPIPHSANDLRTRWGLEGKFVVAYSGNMGRVHAFDAVIDACVQLRGYTDIAFLFVGDGFQKEAVKESA